jgi:hypothetical protein
MDAPWNELRFLGQSVDGFSESNLIQREQAMPSNIPNQKHWLYLGPRDAGTVLVIGVGATPAVVLEGPTIGAIHFTDSTRASETFEFTGETTVDPTTGRTLSIARYCHRVTYSSAQTTR